MTFLLKNLFYVGLLFFIFSCTKPTGPENTISHISTELNSPVNTAFLVKDSLQFEMDEIYKGDDDLTEDFDCTRGIPEPTLDPVKFPNRTFELNEENKGIETVEFKNGDQLIITNDGCEYIILSFEFTTSRFKQDTTDLKYWSESAVKLLENVREHSHTSFDWDKGLSALQSYYHDKNPKRLLGQEINFGGEDIRNFVSLDKIRKVSEKAYEVKVTFGVGPL